jgi:hypothetical protein
MTDRELRANALRLEHNREVTTEVPVPWPLLALPEQERWLREADEADRDESSVECRDKAPPHR